MKLSFCHPLLFLIYLVLSLSGCLFSELFSKKASQKQSDGEVWVSEDGQSWALWTNQAAFGARTRASVSVFENKLWLFGGLNTEYGLVDSVQFYDDVWNSSDGMNWVEISKNSVENLDCPECPENLRGWNLSYVYNGHLWIFGTPTNFSQERMFYSTNGQNWTQWDSIPTKELLLEYTVFNNKLWALSVPSTDESAPADQRENGLWTTEDGFKWLRINHTPAFSPLLNFQLTVFQDQIWLIGGENNEIWKTDSGSEWKKVAEIPELGNITGAEFLHFKEKLWIFGKSGFNYDSNAYFNNTVWQSANGITWSNVQTNPNFGPRRGHTIIAFKEKLWIIGGRQKF